MKALAVNLANNILYRGRRDHIRITPMKLQKLLYYVCRDYAQTKGYSPIDEYFCVWKYGPVLPSVYWEFKAFGSGRIREYGQDAVGQVQTVSESRNPILSKIIDRVWAKYKKLSGVELSKLTHQSSSGWYRAYMENREIITLEDMLHDTSG